MKREGEGFNRSPRAHLMDHWVTDVNGETIVSGLIGIWELIFISFFLFFVFFFVFFLAVSDYFLASILYTWSASRGTRTTVADNPTGRIIDI